MLQVRPSGATPLTRQYTRLLSLAFLGSGLIPLVTFATNRYAAAVEKAPHARFAKLAARAFIGWKSLLLTTLLIIATIAVTYLLRRLEPAIDRFAIEQAEFIASLPSRYIAPGIAIAAGLSLFFELAIIRWQATVLEFFAFYKNLSLLACFAGLGLGYSLARRGGIALFFTIPVLCWEFLLMIGIRRGLPEDVYNTLNMMPFREQLNMGVGTADKVYQALPTYLVIAVVFVITAIAFIPVGQLCGALMERREKLHAYGLNLAGSLAGVVLMFVASAFWTPPVLWFLVVFVGLLLFTIGNRGILLLEIGCGVAALAVLAWPINPMWPRIYTPYQMLELGHNERGLLLIRAAGHYYQRVHDLSRNNRNVDADRVLRSTRDYYELPYHAFGNPRDVAIVGAGTGNDVAAALRSGAASVDAIEIDPAIQAAGATAHPEHPYADPRVHAVVNDARSFLRNTNRTYDLVVYGLLDSHTLLSHASSVRLDSFVYTVEGFREARARLRPKGMISLSFLVLSPELGHKIFLMLQQAFDGRTPICIRAPYDMATVFLISNDPGFQLSSARLQTEDLTDVTASMANPALRTDVSTDDWPFFYMPRRVYPVSYLAMVFLVLLLSAVLVRVFSEDRWHLSHAPFFFLGVGFMLVETKGITELGLTFGNSWQVIGIVIAGIMIMAFLANYTVQALNVQRVEIWYLLLVAFLLLGWYIAGHGGLASTWSGRVGTAVLLTGPMFFSGIVFSTLLRSEGEISGMISANLFGALCGGLLEYNSMYFGFRSLYLIAIAVYLLAFVWIRLPVRSRKSSLYEVSAG